MTCICTRKYSKNRGFLFSVWRKKKGSSKVQNVLLFNSTLSKAHEKELIKSLTRIIKKEVKRRSQ